MADIAVVFHWPPQAMSDMSLEELMDWREQARQRVETDGE
ncbi:GpE family phage tail protein [Agitococcus lubricus]|uniref:GpE protein n=1 Tax=Agitococcus lubricus TaxID=1077255 RepID=A0A2T5J1P8_9GAMM|nr:GpE family phage tail protein [Agitococcus lubricus]PTQ90273.1 GpE protein [Agitococcus lubricus]